MSEAPRRSAATTDGAALDRRTVGRFEPTPEQTAAIRARDPIVALSAGAGAGKTTVLVERFLDLVVRDGVPPTAILAITYTEKAAAEMKERIVRRFEERGDDERRRQAEAAYISTIHGFCARILRENPIAARIDPSFGIIDEMRRSIFLDEQLAALHEDDWFLEHLADFGRDSRTARPTLFQLIHDAAFAWTEFGKGLPAEAGWDVEQHVQAAMARLDTYWRARCEELREELLARSGLLLNLRVSGAKSIELYSAFRELLGRLDDAPIDRAWAEAYCECTSFTRGAGKNEAIDEVRAIVKATREVIKEFADLDIDEERRIEREVIAPLAVRIYERAGRLREAYEEFKRRHGLLDFEDLQRRALSLLELPSIRDVYADRFRHILLDEAQDANDVQIRLVERLCDGRPGLFAVGDVKQAIYGFRGANVALFRDMHAAAGNGKLSLADNYRSREDVIGFVNAAGERLWSDGSIEFERLISKLAYEDDGAGNHVDLWLVEQRKKEEGDSAEDAREREALRIAAWIRDAVEGSEGQPPMFVQDHREKRMRPARYGDFALLAATRTHFPVYERVLGDFGIPTVKDGGRGFFAGREVRDIVSALRVMANPLDDVALLTALRSPLFGWTDADLLRLRRASGRGPLWRAVAAGIAPAEPPTAARARHIIESLRRYATVLSPAELIDLLCEMTAYRATLLCLPRGRSMAANIDKLAEFARLTAQVDGPSLSAFVRRAELAERFLAAETDAPASTGDDDAVSLSTIHGAKGLEWPVVILAALDTDFSRGDRGSRFSPADEALIIAPKDDEGKAIEPAANEPLKAAARQRDEAEARRLFYVGMTRARERLVLSGLCKWPPSDSTKDRFRTPLGWLVQALVIAHPETSARRMALGAAELLVDFISPESVNPLRGLATDAREAELRAARDAVRARRPVAWPRLEPGDAERIATVVERVAHMDSRSGLPAAAAQRALVATTVTQLVYFVRCPLVYYFDLVLQIEEHPTARRKAQNGGEGRLGALERGTLVHELLERADLRADPAREADRLASELPAQVPQRDREAIARMVRATLIDPLLDRARRAERVEREFPFYLDLAGTTVQGVIDLVFAEGDGSGVVVDYKSNDLAAPDRVNVLTEYYRPQVELYALAAKRAGLIEPREATLYFLNKAEARSRPIDERRLEAVEAEAAQVVENIARGAWDTEPGEKCRRCGYRKRGFCEVGKRFVE